MTDDNPERVSAFIDGFSVYYGMLSKGWRHLLWLDYRALLTTLVLPGQELVAVKRGARTQARLVEQTRGRRGRRPLVERVLDRQTVHPKHSRDIEAAMKKEPDA